MGSIFPYSLQTLNLALSLLRTSTTHPATHRYPARTSRFQDKVALWPANPRSLIVIAITRILVVTLVIVVRIIVYSRSNIITADKALSPWERERERERERESNNNCHSSAMVIILVRVKIIVRTIVVKKGKILLALGLTVLRSPSGCPELRS